MLTYIMWVEIFLFPDMLLFEKMLEMPAACNWAYMCSFKEAKILAGRSLTVILDNALIRIRYIKKEINFLIQSVIFFALLR